MELKAGYKKTDVGVIPYDWELKELGEIADIFVGRDLKEKNFSPYQDNVFKYPVYSNTVDSEGLFGYYDIAEYKGDSVTVVGRGVGLGTAFKRNGEYSAIGRLLVLFPNRSVDAVYITEYINNKVKIFEESSGIPQLTGISLSKYKILVPAIPEQRAIAAALSDVDALIAALDRLIAKKRDIKHAAMQELLTGKRRLPGFNEQWGTKTILEIAPLQRGFDLPTAHIKHGIYPVVYSNGVLNYHTEYRVRGPGVVTGRSGTIGSVNYVEQNFWPHNTSLWVTDFKKNNPKFIYYLYSFIGFGRFGTGSGVPTLNRNDVHALRLDIPKNCNKPESMASVLSDMDAEIVAFENRRKKTLALKQGMMQELLAGRIRLARGGAA